MHVLCNNTSCPSFLSYANMFSNVELPSLVRLATSKATHTFLSESLPASSRNRMSGKLGRSQISSVSSCFGLKVEVLKKLNWEVALDIARGFIGVASTRVMASLASLIAFRGRPGRTMISPSLRVGSMLLRLNVRDMLISRFKLVRFFAARFAFLSSRSWARETERERDLDRANSRVCVSGVTERWRLGTGTESKDDVCRCKSDATDLDSARLRGGFEGADGDEERLDVRSWSSSSGNGEVLNNLDRRRLQASGSCSLNLKKKESLAGRWTSPD